MNQTLPFIAGIASLATTLRPVVTNRNVECDWTATIHQRHGSVEP